MKKIREAYIRGQSGEGGDDVSGRAARAAHRLGSASYKSAMKYNQALSDSKKAELERVKAVANGPNKKALEIIEAGALIPHQTKSNPAWGVDFVSGENDELTIQWNTRFTFGESKDDTRTHGTPLAKGLGTIKIDSTDWSHNGINRPIDSISMVTEGKIADGGTLPPTTTVWINTRPYKMSDEDYQRDFGEGVKMQFGADGKLAALEMTRPGDSGTEAQDVGKVQVNIDEVMDNLMSSVLATASEYQQLEEGLK